MIDLSFLKRSRVVHLMFAITFFTSGLIINFIQCILYFGLRPFSKYLYRKLNYYPCYSFYCQLVFMTEWWSGSDVTLYIDKDDFDKYYGKEHGFPVMNHTYEIDWLIGWVFCDRLQLLGNCKACAKKSVQYIPTLGWAWKFAEGVFLDRSWDKDKEIIGSQIRELANYPDVMWFLLFAEGTRFTPEKAQASQKFAREKNLPVLKHHLTPRTKGFTASIPHMKGKVGAIYDVQLAFNPKDCTKPTMTNLLLGKKFDAHMYVKRYPLETVPDNEAESALWLHELYSRKDLMAESFAKHGDFFTGSGVKKTDVFKLKRRYWSLINTVMWAIIVLVPMMYYLIMLLLSGSLVYFSIASGIIFLFFMLLNKTIGMSEIEKGSSYGADKAIADKTIADKSR